MYEFGSLDLFFSINFISNIFHLIGDFEFFQNIEDGSAVTRFWDSDGNETLIGVLKQKYTVKTIAKEFGDALLNISRQNALNEKSVNSINDEYENYLFLTICKDAEVPREYFHRDTNAQVVRSDLDLHRLRRQSTNASEVPNVIYPKLLIIPDYHILKSYGYIENFMKQLIAQFNVIDMMFRELKNPEVHLTISDIILPTHDIVTPYMSPNINADNRIIGDNALFDAEKHFKDEIRRFPYHEWQSILMLTAYPIAFYTNNGANLVDVRAGTGALNRGCKGASIAMFDDTIKSILTLAHELGLRFGARHEMVAAQCENVDGYLMSNDGHSAQPKWSNCSRASLQNYFRSRAKYCGYHRRRKIPDAVKSMLGAWLNVKRQCDNLYNNSTGSCTENQSPSECFIYGCVINGTCILTFSPTLEGMFISNDKGLEACINGTMVPI